MGQNLPEQDHQIENNKSDKQEPKRQSAFNDEPSGSYLKGTVFSFRKLVECPDGLHSFQCQSDTIANTKIQDCFIEHLLCTSTPARHTIPSFNPHNVSSGTEMILDHIWGPNICKVRLLIFKLHIWDLNPVSRTLCATSWLRGHLRWSLCSYYIFTLTSMAHLAWARQSTPK